MIARHCAEHLNHSDIVEGADKDKNSRVVNPNPFARKVSMDIFVQIPNRN